MNEYIKRSQNLTKAMLDFESGYGIEALDAYVKGYLSGRTRVKKALKNIRVQEN